MYMQSIQIEMHKFSSKFYLVKCGFTCLHGRLMYTESTELHAVNKNGIDRWIDKVSRTLDRSMPCILRSVWSKLVSILLNRRLHDGVFSTSVISQVLCILLWTYQGGRWLLLYNIIGDETQCTMPKANSREKIGMRCPYSEEHGQLAMWWPSLNLTSFQSSKWDRCSYHSRWKPQSEKEMILAAFDVLIHGVTSTHSDHKFISTLQEGLRLYEKPLESINTLCTLCYIQPDVKY